MSLIGTGRPSTISSAPIEGHAPPFPQCQCQCPTDRQKHYGHGHTLKWKQFSSERMQKTLPSLCMRQKTSHPFEVPIHPDKRLYGQGNGVTLTTHVRVSQLLRSRAQFAIQLREEPQRHRLTRTSNFCVPTEQFRPLRRNKICAWSDCPNRRRFTTHTFEPHRHIEMAKKGM